MDEEYGDHGGGGRYDELMLDPHRRQAALQMMMAGRHETKMQLLMPPNTPGTTDDTSPTPSLFNNTHGAVGGQQDPAKGQWIDVTATLGVAVLRVFAEQASARSVPSHTYGTSATSSLTAHPSHRTTRPRLVQFRKHATAAVGIAIRGGSEIGLPIVVSKVHPVGPAAASGSDLVRDPTPTLPTFHIVPCHFFFGNAFFTIVYSNTMQNSGASSTFLLTECID